MHGTTDEITEDDDPDRGKKCGHEYASGEEQTEHMLTASPQGLGTRGYNERS